MFLLRVRENLSINLATAVLTISLQAYKSLGIASTIL